MGFGQFDEKEPNVSLVVLDAGAGTDAKRLFWTNNNYSSRVDYAWAQNSTPSDVTLQLGFGPWNSLPSGGTPFARVVVPANAGMGTVPPFDILAAVVAVAARGILLDSQSGLTVALLVALTGSDTVTLLVQGGEL